MKKPSVLMADDHSLILAGLRKLVEGECEVVGTVEDGRALVEAAQTLRQIGRASCRERVCLAV